MDAGVPIKAPVAGIAMGLIKEEGQIAILTDIQGLEDHDGDMDFKVAGTTQGVTALQMDIKIKGVDREVLVKALEQAKAGRKFILDKMLAVIPEPRKTLSPFAPRMITFTIHPDKIRDVIGQGGKVIKKIVEETGVKIDIEDDGRVFIAAIDGDAGEKASKIIHSLTQDIQIGQIYKGKVVKIMDFGAFVEVIPGVLGLPGKDGLVHISQLEDIACEADLVFNTVPAVILDEGILSKLSRDCLVIDLASKPGGVDFNTARDLGIKTIWALSLPGKVAPITAGEAIKDTILNILDERGK
jgi:polyribonucleotide nucleotidyltransferase